MTEYKPMTHEESMALSLPEYIDRCKAWMDEFNDGKLMKVKIPTQCPVHIWVEHNRKACCRELVANIKYCDVCGEACCPDCMNHSVQQLSRVTGYMGAVDGWNAGKKEELKNRRISH